MHPSSDLSTTRRLHVSAPCEQWIATQSRRDRDRPAKSNSLFLRAVALPAGSVTAPTAFNPAVRVRRIRSSCFRRSRAEMQCNCRRRRARSGLITPNSVSQFRPLPRSGVASAPFAVGAARVFPFTPAPRAVLQIRGVNTLRASRGADAFGSSGMRNKRASMDKARSRVSHWRNAYRRKP